MSPTLVTGASGLLGSRLVDVLLARGEPVVALTRDPAAAAIDARCAVVVGDVGDQPLLERAIAAHGATTVFHLAAQTIAGAAREDPAATYATNIIGTTTVLEAARRRGVRRAVVASSVTAYGPSAVPPYTEDMLLAPVDPYDISKAALDLVARSYWPNHGLPVATARWTNVYGGGDRNTSRLVPELIGAALDGRAPEIRSDGTPERDFLHVDDAVGAALALADALDDAQAGARGEAFNAGSGRPVSVRAVVETLERVLARPLHARYDPAPAPPSRQHVSHAKLTRVTGWAPRVDLDEGLRRTVAWHERERERAAA
ncbi:dTDP-glucose 4,6-dehydratase [Baekduia alba]|uniref:NAD-dependent epimerase/dehydratase family protein n=1 Tax=Baekduia alba TaxID=2997333 RepID=UPI0023404D5A|nr:NAD-dependent epimerase/dehydratase family protein [Baekduia alba]WCB94295.1 dTDP-glucose 4,6-dehydratase [Baekduia alba]